MTYALVTPARNEHENLERLSGAVLAQELLPDCWMIVDDGSDDGTYELAARLAAEHGWIDVVQTGGDSAAIAAGRRTGRALDSFRRGVLAFDHRYDVVVKVDADTSFDPGYFKAIVERFRENDDLGIAGGACYELEDGRWVRQKVIPTHPRGASRAYRWECLDDVMSLDSRMGWDGLDEVKARMQGYRSQTFLDLGFRHHRATGGRERSRWAHQSAQGHAAWYMGYRPSYLALRTGYRALREPSALGMLAGYLAAAVRREPRCPEKDVVRHLRREQRLTATLLRGTPP
jgi:glycosyltransferase involved in cell wall biosynthesis